MSSWTERASGFVLDRLSSKDLHKLGYTAVIYDYPVKPRSEEKPRFWENTVSHVGIWKNAVDFIVPDPRITPLPIFAPADGVITQIVQSHQVHGTGEEFAHFANYLVVVGYFGEIYKIIHIAKDSCVYSVGSKVKRGERLATTGVNGWMTDVRHSHFEVGVGVKYQTLKIRWTGV